MATIKVDIVSAEGEIHSGTASMVFAPAKMGEVGIAPRHAPMLTPLSPGEAMIFCVHVSSACEGGTGHPTHLRVDTRVVNSTGSAR